MKTFSSLISSIISTIVVNTVETSANFIDWAVTPRWVEDEITVDCDCGESCGTGMYECSYRAPIWEIAGLAIGVLLVWYMHSIPTEPFS